MSLRSKVSKLSVAESFDTEGHRSMRAKLRHATFIDPRTGDRSRRSFSLHSSREDSPTVHEGHIETTPLLSYLGAKPDSEAPTTTLGKIGHMAQLKLYRFRSFITSETGKSVFKCALAYTLGSMYTFIPVLADIMGRADSKHTVATITVYFHPARSRGSMLKALVCAFSAFLYTAIVSVTSMGVSVLFTDYLHQVVIGHIIVLIVFVGCALGIVGWVKMKMGDPLINISCSLVSLSLISVLTNEGAVQVGDLSFRKIGLYLRMIVAGVTASMLVSFFVLPVSARKQFKKSAVDVTDALSDMLGIIASSFLSGNEAELEDSRYSAASEQQRKSAASLNQYLAESGYELKVIGYETEAKIQAKMVECIRRIAQSMGGLRSAAAMQFISVKQLPVNIDTSGPPSYFTQFGSITTSPAKTPGLEHSQVIENSIDTILSETPTSAENSNRAGSVSKSLAKFRTARQIFELFIDHLGPSMRSLAFTMKEILDDLPFNSEQNYVVENNPEFRNSLDRALELYKSARKEALEQVYNSKDLNRNRPLGVEADWEEAAACCGHFSFCLLEVAEQLKEYLIVLDELDLEVTERSSGRSWKWLKFWRSSKKDENATLPTTRPSTFNHGRNESYSISINYPKHKKPIHTDTLQVENKRQSWKRRALRKTYGAFSFFRRDDKKFAIKVGLGALLYATPSYVEVTRPIYKTWRGEWGLLSYMLVCSMTIGASNTTGLQRFSGTCLGAIVAIAAWHVSQGHAIPLIFFGFCMSYWTSNIIVGQGRGPMGRFIMLTYNLSALYAYTLSMNDDLGDGDEEDANHNPKIWIIALHRVVTVLTGCVWGLIVTRMIWPISARRKIKDGLSLLWLRMGLIWKRDPLSIFIHGESQHNYMNLREEMELQSFHNNLSALRNASQHEFSMRRPFPTEAYNRILQSTARMLEAFHTMNYVIQKDLQPSPGEIALLHSTAKERNELCARISHQFSVLASSMKIEYSMNNDALPNSEHTRDRLLARVFDFRRQDAGTKAATDADFGLLYTYALVTGLIGMEIQNCLRETEALFGSLDEESLWLQ